MAFRNDPRIPAATRERIRRIATEIGYEPDPMLASLAAYRSRLRPSSYRGTLAWLISSRGGYDWTHIRHFRGYHEGAQQSAQRHGFMLEVFDLAKRGFTPEKLAAVFRARNIAGIFVCPQPTAGTEITGFPWDDFSAVTFGYTLKSPRLHTVAAAQFQAAIDCTQRLREAGRKRIGFVLSQDHLERTALTYLGGYLAAQEMAGAGGQIPVQTGDQPDKKSLRAWVNQHKPDGIVGGRYMTDILQEFGFRVPQDIGVACPLLSNDEGETSGVWENSVQIGMAAADLLVSMLTRGERGLPAAPQRVNVVGNWITGNTL